MEVIIFIQNKIR